ncbi:TIGR01440 family protein [Ornithinibacillus scapharcae]|uniref:TIGR01440 family protein n=1 Tax=Ornithinibacillus scapharcae TaxID=1147159 RepID=UPI000527FBB2|nr:TIGR01440 family protein [Ornithinibacillus scapharcae]
METIQSNLHTISTELLTADYLESEYIFVIGCSTSEVAGEHIGTAGSEDIAAHIFQAMQKLQSDKGIRLAFQCCEHLNRALVVERETMEKFQLEEVAVVPIPKAGGSMASYAYKHFNNPVVVEKIQAHAGIDIGETMIGMHLKHVAVPVRLKQRYIGDARVNVARTRPKLIGGSRAVYDRLQDTNSCT